MRMLTHYRVYNLLSEDLRANKEIAIEAIKRWPYFLEWSVPSKFLEDKDNLDAAIEIVKESVQRYNDNKNI